MANDLTLTSAAYDTTGEDFGTAALSGGYGVAPGGLIPSFPCTWECKFKRASAPSSLEVVMGQSGLGWFGMTSAGAIQFEMGNGQSPTVDFTSAGSVADGEWHHAAISATANSFIALLDGNPVGTSGSMPTVASFTPQNAPPSATGYLGVRNHGGSLQFPFGGEVDEAAVWSTARYAGAFTPPATPYVGNEAGLLALWHLDGNGTDSAGSQAPSISAPSVSGTTVGGTTTVSGSFANGAPAGLSQVLDGTTSTVSTPTITTTGGSGANAAGTYSYSIPTPAAGSHSIEVDGTGSFAATGSPAAFTTSSTPPVTVLPSNPAIAYSPYNWAGGKTINPGAYFSLAFTGTLISLNFDLSALSAPLPELWVSIDGQPAQQFTLAGTITPAMPSSTAAWPKHSVEVLVKSTSEFVSRWSPQAAAVALTSITLANGAVVSAPAIASRNVLAYGDSITEAYHAVANLGSGQTDTDGSDAALGWAYMLRRLLGAELGIVGFGGTGLLNNGQGAVPPVGQSFNQMWSGQARTFTPRPNLVVINEGENDRTASPSTFQSAFQSFLVALLAAIPTCPVAVLRPFSGAQAGAIQAAIQAVGNPRLHYIDTTGLFDTSLSVDGQHPLGVANLTAIGPGVAALLSPLLVPGVVNRWTH